VGVQRWQIAQQAEARYWQVARQDDVELMRIMHEKAVAMRWALNQVPGLERVPGPWVEIGIGPLGIGCIHLTANGGRELIGVDPLATVDLEPSALSPVFRSILAGCHTASYRHVVGRGEMVDLGSEVAALVVCYNVLDHCEDPAAVIAETARLLLPGGHFVLGCDVYSEAGRIKHRVRGALARATGRTLNSIADLAHPHQFVARDLEGLMKGANLDILAVNTRPAELFKRAWSHSYRMLIVGRRKES
jgi:SAM-dependent methyltransferase